MKKFEELENGKEYIAKGTDGRKYKGTAKYFDNIKTVNINIKVKSVIKIL